MCSAHSRPSGRRRTINDLAKEHHGVHTCRARHKRNCRRAARAHRANRGSALQELRGRASTDRPRCTVRSTRVRAPDGGASSASTCNARLAGPYGPTALGRRVVGCRHRLALHDVVHLCRNLVADRTGNATRPTSRRSGHPRNLLGRPGAHHLARSMAHLLEQDHRTAPRGVVQAVSQVPPNPRDHPPPRSNARRGYGLMNPRFRSSRRRDCSRREGRAAVAEADSVCWVARTEQTIDQSQ